MSSSSMARICSWADMVNVDRFEAGRFLFHAWNFYLLDRSLLYRKKELAQRRLRRRSPLPPPQLTREFEQPVVAEAKRS